MNEQVELYKRFAEGDSMVVYRQVWDYDSQSWIKTDELVDLEKVNLFDQDRMEDTRSDEELDDLEYYGRHGWSREAPVCDDPECFMCGEED